MPPSRSTTIPPSSTTMPPKRGRPPLDTDDLATIQRRQKNAERARRFYNRRKASHAAITPVTHEQLQQGEAIVDLAFTHEDAVPTPTEVGLRVPPGIILAQDPKNAHLQATAVEVDEHDMLYHGKDQDTYQDQDQGHDQDQGQDQEQDTNQGQDQEQDTYQGQDQEQDTDQGQD